MTPATALRAVAGQFGIDALYGFGSRAAEAWSFVEGRGALDPAHPSDLDLAALPAIGQLWDAADRVALVDALERVFAARRVDLVVLPEAPALLALAAVSGELLYARDRHREAEYQLYVLPGRVRCGRPQRRGGGVVSSQGPRSAVGSRPSRAGESLRAAGG